MGENIKITKNILLIILILALTSVSAFADISDITLDSLEVNLISQPTIGPNTPYIMEDVRIFLTITNNGPAITAAEMNANLPTIIGEDLSATRIPKYTRMPGYWNTTGNFNNGATAKIMLIEHFTAPGTKTVSATFDGRSMSTTTIVTDVDECYDSDGGENIFSKGWTIGTIPCLDQSSCTTNLRFEDNCNGDTLNEFVCLSDDGVLRAYYQTIQCDTSCVNGACVNSNNPPTLYPIGSKTINENQILQFALNGSDIDGDTLTFEGYNLPSGANFNPNTNIFSWTPDYSQAGIYSVTFIVSDGNGGTDSEIVTITVNDVCQENWVLDSNICQSNDLRLISYTDTNACGTTNNLPSDDGTYEPCDYCTPNLINSSWSPWSDSGTCNTYDNQLQTRSLTQYDSNYCDEIANVTFTEYRNLSCDYCTPSWTLNSTWTACDASEIQFQYYYDTNSCYAATGLPSDLTGEPNPNNQTCFFDNDGDGYTEGEGDCDDDNYNVNPGVSEILNNGIDDDCNASTLDSSLDIDDDGDGYTENQGDCNDNNNQTYPGAFELCDGEDNDCNALTSDGSNESWLNDPTVCGVGECASTGNYICSAGTQTNTCTAGTPTAETCDGLDNDCNGFTDENLTAPLADLTQGVCSGSLKTCDGSNGWIEPDYNLIVDYESGSETTCDSLDNDCDGTEDETLTTIYYEDNDNDLFGNPSVSTQQCNQPSGYVLDNTDCNDDNININPNATEICDGIDNDCSLATNDGTSESWLGNSCDGTDTDLCEEGNYICNAGIQTCTDNTSDNLELCNGIDDDCNAATDDGTSESWFGQATSCGVGECADSGTYTCNLGSQYDTCTAGSPIAETCNGLDDDCNGQIDNGVLLTFYLDFDNDLFGNLTDTTQACAAPIGYVSDSTDCNDNNAGVNPNATEILNNGIDDDCNPSTLDSSLDIDDDGDGYTENEGDCDDDNNQTYPGAPELCDGIDNDCNAGTNDGTSESWLNQPTACGVGECASIGNYICSAGTQTNTCVAGTPTTETCDGLDNDCNGVIDNDLTAPNNTNQLGVCFGSTRICTGASGWIDDYSLIADYEADNETTCDLLDNDCDGLVDETLTTTFYLDLDGDFFGNLTNTTQSCVLPVGYVTDNTDCNDNNNSINPNATEIYYNGIDDDCNALTKDIDQDNDGYNKSVDCDDTNPSLYLNQTYYWDIDTDGFTSGSAVTSCTDGSVPIGATTSYNPEDCNDDNNSINPNATEIANNGIDEDCNGEDLIIDSNINITLISPVITEHPLCGWKWINSTNRTNTSLCNVERLNHSHTWDIEVSTDGPVASCSYEFGKTDMSNYYKNKLNITPIVVFISNGTLDKNSDTSFSKYDVDPLDDHNFLKIRCIDNQGFTKEITSHVELDLTHPGNIDDLVITPIIENGKFYDFNLTFTMPGDDGFSNVSPIEILEIYYGDGPINDSNWMNHTFLLDVFTTCYDTKYNFPSVTAIPGKKVTCKAYGKDSHYNTATQSWTRNPIYYSAYTLDNVFRVTDFGNSPSAVNRIEDCLITKSVYSKSNPRIDTFTTLYPQNFISGDESGNVSIQVKNIGDGAGCNLTVFNNIGDTNPFNLTSHLLYLEPNQTGWVNFSFDLPITDTIESYGADMTITALELYDNGYGVIGDSTYQNDDFRYISFLINYSNYPITIYASNQERDYLDSPYDIPFLFDSGFYSSSHPDFGSFNSYDYRKYASLQWIPVTITNTAKLPVFINDPTYSHGTMHSSSTLWNPTNPIYADMLGNLTITQVGVVGHSYLPFMSRANDGFNAYIATQNGGSIYTYQLCTGYYEESQFCGPNVTLVIT